MWKGCFCSLSAHAQVLRCQSLAGFRNPNVLLQQAASQTPPLPNRASSISVSKYKIKMQPEDAGWWYADRWSDCQTPVPTGGKHPLGVGRQPGKGRHTRFLQCRNWVPTYYSCQATELLSNPMHRGPLALAVSLRYYRLACCRRSSAACWDLHSSPFVTLLHCRFRCKTSSFLCPTLEDAWELWEQHEEHDLARYLD